MFDLLSILVIFILLLAICFAPTPKWFVKLESKFDKFFERQKNTEIADAKKATKELDSLNKFSKKAPD